MGSTPCFTCGSRFKHCLVTFVKPGCYVLYCLARQLIPMGKPGQPFQFRDMIYQPKPADILTIEGIVPTLESNTMIPYMSVSTYALVQLTIPVIAIHLELVGFHRSGLCPLYPVSQGSGRPYRAIEVKLSHETQDKPHFTCKSKKMLKHECIPSINVS